jgi:hypothetical protein
MWLNDLEENIGDQKDLIRNNTRRMKMTQFCSLWMLA